MTKLFELTVITLIVICLSGCYCVGTHVAPVNGGKKATTGIFAFDAIDNGYPMIPFYSKFEAAQ